MTRREQQVERVVSLQEVGVFQKYDAEDGFRQKHLQSRSSTKTLSNDRFKDSPIKHQPNTRSLPNALYSPKIEIQLPVSNTMQW